jgi:hypothetical protein
MRLSFDSIEEVQEFVKKLKGTRGGKDKGDETETGNAPQPLQPPVSAGVAQTFAPGGMQGFAAPGAGAGQAGGAFPAAAAPDPAIVALVQRIVAKLDSALASGQPADQALAWFKSQCGPGTENFTLDQIKQVALPKLAQPQLEAIAKLMAA